jgi:hypothetical protein
MQCGSDDALFFSLIYSGVLLRREEVQVGGRSELSNQTDFQTHDTLVVLVEVTTILILASI